MINPCPFCKSNFVALSGSSGNDWSALCLNCRAKTEHFTTQEKALKAWNNGSIYRQYSNLHNS